MVASIYIELDPSIYIDKLYGCFLAWDMDGCVGGSYGAKSWMFWRWDGWGLRGREGVSGVEWSWPEIASSIASPLRRHCVTGFLQELALALLPWIPGGLG